MTYTAVELETVESVGSAQSGQPAPVSDEQLAAMLVERARTEGLQLTGVDEMVLSLSEKGLTHGEIAARLAEVYGAEVSRQAISTITDKVMEGMSEWQNRPLDRVYPVLFVDAINVKIRDGQVANRPVYVVTAVTVDGTRDSLGIWAGDGGEGAK